MLERIFKGMLVAGLAWAGLVGAARAGQYHVYSCRMPDGEVAPVDGWGGVVAEGGAFDPYALNTCGEGGALVAALGDQTVHAANVDLATWTFAAPPEATIAAATLIRAGQNTGGQIANATYQFWLAGPDVDATFDECIFTLGCAGKAAERVSISSAHLGRLLYVDASCGGETGKQCPADTGDPSGYAAAVYIYAADLTLEQNAGPSASNVSGELASAPAVRGASDVAFDATDPGAGVYEAVVRLDGNVVQRTVLDDNGGRCRDVGETTDGLPAFLYVQPCEQSVSVDVPWDTTKAANGVHRLLVSVSDAAGNEAPVLDRLVTIDNPPAPGTPGPLNGVNASTPASLKVRWARTERTTVSVGFDQPERLTGQLLSAGGAPISGAMIDVAARPSYAGAKGLRMPSPRTDAEGRFAMLIAPGTSSRTLRFAYRVHLGDRLAAATRTLRLSRRAGIALRVSPHTASAGSTIDFHGRLRGGPIPSGGKALVLEARSPGSPWIEFKVIHSDAHGRYKASYRFKFPGPAEYSFRARSETEADYPFSAGASNVVAVHER